MGDFGECGLQFVLNFQITLIDRHKRLDRGWPLA
jgi:hypothetical protein